MNKLKRGRSKYIPRETIKEMVSIKEDHGLFSDSEAFRKMAQYSEVGREAERIKDLDWRPRKDKKRGGWL